MACAHDGRSEAAAELFRQLIEREPGNAQAYANLGAMLRKLGRAGEALAVYEAGLAQAPLHAGLRGNLANLLVAELDRPAEAEAHLRRLVELEPGNAQAHANLGAVLRRLDRLTEAEPPLRRAIELEPDNARAYVELGAVLRKLGRAEAALPVYEAGLAQAPLHAGLRADLASLLAVDFANALLMQGLAREGGAAAERALALRPDDRELNRGTLFGLLFRDDLSPAEVAARHRAWGERLIASVPLRLPHANPPDPGRRLQSRLLVGRVH